MFGFKPDPASLFGFRGLGSGFSTCLSTGARRAGSQHVLGRERLRCAIDDQANAASLCEAPATCMRNDNRRRRNHYPAQKHGQIAKVPPRASHGSPTEFTHGSCRCPL